MTLITPNEALSIDTIAANGVGGASPTQIVRGSGVTAVIVTADVDNTDVLLPDNCVAGDVVEIFSNSSSYGVNVFAIEGESFTGSSITYIYQGTGRRFRKITSALWGATN